jgi:uncharacterized protein YgiM (DUF1202 family)
MFKKVFSFLVLVHVSSLSWGQNLDSLLVKADSLFAQQRFTQSFLLYDSIYTAGKEASPSMLLKMAYIKEGLNDVTAAQYYLNEYYLITKNEQALQKMEDLAEANDLSGYQHNDITFFYSLYYENYNWLVLGVIFLCLLFFSLVLYQKRKQTGSVWFNGFLLVVLLAGLFALVNFGRDYNRGVVITNNTYVMADPSSGADLIDVISKGHKVVVEKKRDVWYQIEWQGQDAYIKAKNVKLLNIW